MNQHDCRLLLAFVARVRILRKLVHYKDPEAATTKHAMMAEIIEHNGDNDFKLPHKRKLKESTKSYRFYHLYL